MYPRCIPGVTSTTRTSRVKNTVPSPKKMSYISGQQGPFDDQMLRIGASDNYFLSPPPYGGGPESTSTSTSHGPGSGSGPGSGPGMASASASAISMDSELNLSFLQHPGLDVHVKEEDQGFPVLMGGPLSNGMARGHSMVESVPDSITDSMSRRNNNGDSSYTSPMSSGQGQGSGSASQTAGPGLGQGPGQDKSESSGMKADSEEEQIRRKRAMNRAAQKAFRERKEARVKQLEQQLKDSERDREQLLSELEDLRKHNIEMHAENRILLQTKSAGVPGVPIPGPLPLPLAQGLGQGISQSQGIKQSIPQGQRLGAGPGTCPTKFTFPSKRDFVEELIDLQDQTYDAETVSRTQPVNYSHDGQEMMTISATWEYLHKVSERIDFDLSLVMCKLKGKQVCHGKGPSFYKSDVDRYIQEA